MKKLLMLVLLALAASMANGIITQLGLYDRLPGLSIPMGAMVLATTKDGPAERAGLLRMDRIVSELERAG